MVGIKEKLKLDRSATNAQAARKKLAANGRKFNVLDKKEEKVAKKFKIVLAEKPNFQEAAERSRNRQYCSCCCCRSHI